MIIDSHLHIRGDLSEDISKPCTTIIEEFKKDGIDRSCLMHSGNLAGHLYWNEAEQLLAARQLKKILETYPDNFYALLIVNPLLPAPFLIKILKEYIVNGPLTGIKFSILMNARDKRMDELCGFMEKHDIPVLWHSWYKTTSKYLFESDPSDIAYFAKKFPRLRILMAHLTAARARGIQDIRDCLNVSVDTSGSQPEDGYMEYAIKHIGSDRILFGSDYPCRDIPVQLGRIESVDLPTADKEKILYSNALRFFEGALS